MTSRLPLRIDGQWVDLSAYASKHRGGRWLLEYARNKDVTMLFHAIHVMNPESARSALAALPRIPADEAPDQPLVFSLDSMEKLRPAVDTAFRDELHEMVRRKLGERGNKATAAHWARTVLFAAVTVSAWAGWVRGDATAALVLPFAHWLLAAHTCHDATHGSLSTNPAVNYALQFTAHPIFFNVFVWIPQHLLSHHQYTNELDDVDIHHFAPVSLSTKVDGYGDRPSNPWTFVIKGCLTTIGTCVLQPCRTVFASKTPNFDVNITPVSDGVSRMTVALSILPSLAVLLWPLLEHTDKPHFLLLWLWPWLGSSLIWTGMTQTSHIQAQCQDSENADDDWTKQQIKGSLDYSVHGDSERRLVAMLTGGLNAQALHHALPTISQCHLADIYEDYVRICAKHNVPRSTSANLLTAATEMFDFVFTRSRSLQRPKGELHLE